MTAAGGMPATGPWLAFGASVRGTAHMARGMPNQDAWLVRAEAEGCGPIAAVADGHGGAAHPLSDQGARLAVEAAVSTLAAFCAQHARSPAETARRAAETELPARLVAAWRERVDAHPAAGRGPDRHIAFGTTLLAAMLMPEHLLLLQNGDGAILLAGPDGQMRRPLPEDPRLADNATTSLCLPSAAADFRVRLLPRPAGPALLLLTTDGYENAFTSRAAFDSAMAGYGTQLCRHGSDRVAAALEGWLADASARGSGDDCTLVLLARAAPATPSARRRAGIGLALAALVLAATAAAWLASSWRTPTAIAPLPRVQAPEAATPAPAEPPAPAAAGPTELPTPEPQAPAAPDPAPPSVPP